MGKDSKNENDITDADVDAVEHETKVRLDNPTSEIPAHRQDRFVAGPAQAGGYKVTKAKQ